MILNEKKFLDRLDKMLEDGINGTFEETNFDETRLSKLETKWLRYLESSKISHKKNEEERKKLKELVSDISHQTKTPIANILLYIQLLEEQELDEQSKRLVGEIKEQSEKLEFLIESLVKISRLEAGTFQLEPKTNDIKDIVDRAILQVSPKADNRKISIYNEKKSIEARFDAKWTQEAVFNVLDNAVKYGKEGGQIKVKIEVYEMFAAIIVSDDGIGISEEELPRIFGRFYRGENVREKSGVGIGLYLSRQIIEEQGGYITVESKIDKGTAFKIYLQR